jgi:hypothetical protein
MPVVLYGSETWSLTSNEGQGLRMFEKRVLSIKLQEPGEN